MHRAARTPSGVPTVETIVLVIAALAVAAALAGLYWPGGEGTYTITTYRGQEEEIFGRGLYRDSSVFNGAGARGTDAVTILVGVPLLLARLVWMLYVYASTSLGTVAWHDFFLMHVAIFLVASGEVMAGIWLIEPVAAQVSGDLPESLGVSTTLFTTAFDITVIVLATWVIAALVRRGRPAGYLLAVPILILEAMLAPIVIAQTIFQIEGGIEFTPAQVAIFIGGFMALALVAKWMLRGIFRHVDDPVGWRISGHGHAGAHA